MPVPPPPTSADGIATAAEPARLPLPAEGRSHDRPGCRSAGARHRVLRDADRDRMCLPWLELTTVAWRGGAWPGADIYHVEIANVATLESNSPVMIDDVVVGSVGPMTGEGTGTPTSRSRSSAMSLSPPTRWPASVRPACSGRCTGAQSAAGSARDRRLQPGATIPLNRASTYPSTEQTLSSLSVVVNGGGLGQFGGIVHNFNAALSGRAGAVRDLLTRLDKFVGTLDQQRDNIVTSIQALNRLADTFAGQHDVITAALRKIPPALDVLIKERPRLTEALDRLRVFSDTATKLVNDSQADLVKNLKNLEPTIRALADVGPDLDASTRARRSSRSGRTSSIERFAVTTSTVFSGARPHDSAAQARACSWGPTGEVWERAYPPCLANRLT